MSLLAGFIDIGDPVSTMNFFDSVHLTSAVRYLFLSVILFIFQLCRYLILIRRILRQLLLFPLQLRCAFCVCSIPFVWILWPSALSFRNCCIVYPMPDICEFGSKLVRYKTCNVCFVIVFFGPVPNRSLFCIGSSYISFSRFVNKASSFVFSRFSFVFCMIISIVFFESSFFSFINLSLRFVSVIAVMNFEMSKSSAVIV